MIFDLSKVEFVNDVFKYEIESGTLIFYSVNESIKSDDLEVPIKRVVVAVEDLEVPIKRVVVAVEDLDGNQTILSSIIGFEKDGYLVSSDDSALEGQILTTDNIASCTLEIPDEE